MMIRLLALFLIVLTTACTQAPQPLRHSRTGLDVSGLRLRDGGVVYIQPIEGIARPLAQILSNTLVESLGARGIPATTNLLSNPAYTVRAQIFINRQKNSPKTNGAIYWTFRKQEDGSLLEYSTPIDVDSYLWRFGDQNMIDGFAEEAADNFASTLQDKRERDAVELAERERDVIFYIDQIDGAPGDGNQALRKAMTLTLRQLGGLVSGKKVRNAYVLSGEIRALEPFEGKQRVKIDWIVKGLEGQELGRAQLNNQLEEGRLQKPWGRLAYEISRAAVQSIGLMVERDREEQAFNRSRYENQTSPLPGRRN